jgi:hypothetical protein
MESGSASPRARSTPALLKAVARARVWFDELASGRVRSLAGVARNQGIAKRYVERLSRLAFVAPAIVEAICHGQQPAELSAETLLNRINLPLEWLAQRHTLGIGWTRSDSDAQTRSIEIRLPVSVRTAMSRRNLPAAAKRTVSLSLGEDPGRSGRFHRKERFLRCATHAKNSPAARISRLSLN